MFGRLGLLLLDLGETARVPGPMQMRLLGLTRQRRLAAPGADVFT